MQSNIIPWYEHEYPDLCKYTRRKELIIKVPNELVDEISALYIIIHAILNKIEHRCNKIMEYCFDHLRKDNDICTLLRGQEVFNKDERVLHFKRWLTQNGYTWSE